MSIEQNYYYIKEEEYDKKLNLNKSSSLRYYSKKKIKKMYPRGGYIVVGGIGSGLINKQGQVDLGEMKLDFYALHYSKYQYGIEGYIAVGENQYLAVIGKRRCRNLLIVFVAISIAALLVAGTMHLVKESDIETGAMDYTPPEQLNIVTDPNHIAIPGYKEILMNAGTDTAYVALWNPPNNPCYFKFTIVNLENEKVLYQSKLIMPGKAVTEIKFNQTIAEGKYPIEIKIDTFSLDDKEVSLNGGVSKAELIAVKSDN